LGLIADILLLSGALAATAYCVVLSRRLKRFSDLESGVGGAIATLSTQVDDMTRALSHAEESAVNSSRSLEALTGRAEEAARRLELLVASLHDIPEGPPVATQEAMSDPGSVAPVPTRSEPLFQSRRGPFPEAAE
jgi:hypothetical protein